MADKNFIQQCFVTNEPYFVRKNGGHPRTLLMSDSGFNPYRVIYTTQRYLQGPSREVRAFIAASLRGLGRLHERRPVAREGADRQE